MKSNQYQTKLSKYLKLTTNSPPESKKQDPLNIKPLNEAHHTPQQKQRKSHPLKTYQERREYLKPSNEDRKSSILAKQQPAQVEVISRSAPKQLNVEFYLNIIASQPSGQLIDTMHQDWYRDYQKLQRNHAYIQWIFPNSYQSRFNMHAEPLSVQQAEQFRTNPLIIKRYVKSYEMMLAFYGLKLKDKSTGQLMRSRHPNYKQRYYKTFLTSFHNHMRVTRILTSLKETGFGRFAMELCKLLKNQIYSQSGEMGMLRRYDVYKDWQPYEKFVEESEKISIYFTRSISPRNHLKVEQPSHRTKQDSFCSPLLSITLTRKE